MNRPSPARAPSATITLRTLGALELTGNAAGPLEELLTRPKPLAVLLYLALADDAGRQRRDTLLATFWPDAEPDRARTSLRQAIYQLRRGLGADAVDTRGDDVAIVRGAIDCDVSRLERRLAEGDLAGAVALYRGDLLPGFFIDGAPAFDIWLDARRRQLRDAAAGAARALVDQAERRDDADAAIEWSRRAVSIAPDDEPAVRRLIALLDRVGDRARAVHEFDRFARRLREQYGLEPSGETSALVAALRASPGPPEALLDPRRVVVPAFDNETGVPALDSIGRLIADTVAQGIAQLENVHVVPLTASLVSARYVSAAASDAPGAERARLVATETRAGTFVAGAYFVTGDELTVQGWIGDARTGDVLLGIGPARASLGAPHPAIASLRDEARTSLARQLETRVLHVRATGRAPSYEAHAAYVEGLVLFLEGDWRGALDLFGRATAADATYLLPLSVSAIARWNLGELPAAEALVERALPLARGASPFDRALVDMVRAWLAGDWAAAYDAVRRQSELAPASIASFAVAEEARRRNRPREALRQLAALDPMRGEMRGWIFYWVVQCQALHMLGEHTRELESARRARALYPEAAFALRLELHALAALGDVAGVRAVVEESLATPARSEPRPGALMREAALELRAHGHARDVADELLRQSLAWYEELSSEERERLPIRRALARARHDVGDWEGATAEFAALAGDRVRVADCGAVHHPHLQAHLDHGYLGVLAIHRGDAAEAARIDALLERERGPFLFGSTHYWRAAMAALRGDADAAARLLRRAFASGLPHEPFIHADPYLSAGPARAAIAALLAPRG